MRTTVFIGRHRAEVASYDTKGDHVSIVISESVADTAEIQFCDTAKGVDHWPTISLADLRAFLEQRESKAITASAVDLLDRVVGEVPR